MSLQDAAENPEQIISQFFDEAGGLSGFLFAVSMAVITGLVIRRFMD